MKKQVLTLLCIPIWIISFSQEDAPTSYSSLFNVSASRYEPGILGRNLNWKNKYSQQLTIQFELEQVMLDQIMLR